MKKLLSIIVLGLLLSGNAYATKYNKKQDIYKTVEYKTNLCIGHAYASKKSKRRTVLNPKVVYHFVTGGSCPGGYFAAQALEECNDFLKRSSAKLYCHKSYIFSTGFTQNNKISQYNRSQAQSVRKQKNLSSFKQTCKKDDLNKEGTKRLADCVKKLQLKLETLQNKTYSKPKNSITTSKPKRTIDPSVWDDIIRLSTDKIWGSSKSKTAKKVCIRTGQEKIGFGKSCRYSCTGSLYTMMVGSLEMCPLTVER